MKTKLSILKEYLQNNDPINALRIAAKFGQLGEHKKAITAAWAAYINPQFYKQLGKDPKKLIAAGIAAIHQRYNLD